jgi:Immunity protein Imm1
MTLQGTIQWGQNEFAVVDSPDAFGELVTCLQGRADPRPIMIDVIASDGRSLTLGLGRAKAVLSLAGPDGSPPYYASMGDENAEGDISFEYHGQTTDFQLRHAVPVAAARAAVVQFLTEQGLPDAVRWEEV